MPRSLADGHEKVVILTSAPSNPAAPTATELNAGIDVSNSILASDWAFGPTNSDTFGERAVGEELTPNSYGTSNGQFGATFFRYFNSSTGVVDPTADAAFAAVKVKGTTVWVYSRKTGKKSSAVFATGDEIWYGAEVLTDTPQAPSQAGGYIKNRVNGQVQKAYPFFTIA